VPYFEKFSKKSVWSKLRCMAQKKPLVMLNPRVSEVPIWGKRMPVER
jgi:hypothetical protein